MNGSVYKGNFIILINLNLLVLRISDKALNSERLDHHEDASLRDAHDHCLLYYLPLQLLLFVLKEEEGIKLSTSH
jgi:hypothetical protein